MTSTPDPEGTQIATVVDEGATQLDDTQFDGDSTPPEANEHIQGVIAGGGEAGGTVEMELEDDEEESLVYDEMTQRYPTQQTQDEVDDSGAAETTQTQRYPTQDADDITMDFEAPTQKFSSPSPTKSGGEEEEEEEDPDATQIDEGFELPPAPPKDTGAEEKARIEAEEKAKLEAEEKARADAAAAAEEIRLKEEAEEKAKIEAEEKAKIEAEEKARADAAAAAEEIRLKEEAEEKARIEAEEKARADAAAAAEEIRLKEEAEEKAKIEAEEKAKIEAEEKARADAAAAAEEIRLKEEAEEKAKIEAEEKARIAEEKERIKAEEEEEARVEADAKALRLQVATDIIDSPPSSASPVTSSSAHGSHRSSSRLRATAALDRSAEMDEVAEAHEFLKKSANASKKSKKPSSTKASAKSTKVTTAKASAKPTKVSAPKASARSTRPSTKATSVSTRPTRTTAAKPAAKKTTSKTTSKSTTKTTTKSPKSAPGSSSAKRKASTSSVASPPTKKLRARPSETINILCTGIQADMKDLVKKVPNAVLIENARSAKKATHVIVCSKNITIRRTPKLLIALCSSSAPHFLGIEWLEASAQAKAALPVDDFLISTKAYKKMVNEFKTKFGVDLCNVVASKSAEAEPMLANTVVTFEKGLAGNRFPPEAELKLIVEAAGGKFVKTPGKAANLLVVTDDNAKITKKVKDGYKKLVAKGGDLTIVGKSDWLTKITTQSM